MQYPDAAMQRALQLVTDRHLYFRKSEPMQTVCKRICVRINEDFSIPEGKCLLNHQALSKHFQAAADDQIIAKPGHPSLIYQEVVDTWVAWVCLDVEDQRSPLIDQALYMLWELCDEVDCDVPAEWKASVPPFKWWVKKYSGQDTYVWSLAAVKLENGRPC